MTPAATGRPAYHPSTLLKIYLYGYLNRVQSSRRLEREAQRNVELMWLTRRLAPDFKTIADFRRNNGPAIRKVCSRFVTLCRNLKLFSEAIVAIDGSKFKAVNNRDRNFTEHKIKMRLAHLEASVQEYLEQLDRADRQPAEVPEERVKHLKDKMATVKKEIRRLEGIEKDLAQSPDQQVSLTDPDSRSMNSAGKGTGIVGNNVQAVVDAKNHLIVAHEVTNEGSERSQLTNMAKMGREATWQTKLTVLADRGYFNGKEILDCDRAGFIPLSCREEGDLAHDNGRARHDAAPVLVVGLPQVSNEGAVHAQPVPKNYPLGTRRSARQDATSVGQDTRGIEMATPDGRACLRDAQNVDGINPLPDQDAAKSAN